MSTRSHGTLWYGQAHRADGAPFVMPRLVRTRRLALEPLRAAHLPAFARFFADADSTRFLGGPVDAAAAWKRFAVFAGHWSLAGFGPYALTDEEGAFVGYAGLWRPADWPEVEIMYGLLPHARGKGYGAEAVRAIRAIAEGQGVTSLVSYVAPDNAASLALARRAGAEDDGRITLGGSEGVVMRYRVDPDAAGEVEEDEILLESSAMPLMIRSSRLVLCPWRADHAARHAAFWADAESTRFLGGPREPATAWRKLAAEAGQWALFGYGLYAVEAEGTLVALAGLQRAAKTPETELFFATLPDSRGRGYATDAAAAVRAVAAEQGLSRLVSTIHSENSAARAVADRLGAVAEDTVTRSGVPAIRMRHPLTRSDPGPRDAAACEPALA